MFVEDQEFRRSELNICLNFSQADLGQKFARDVFCFFFSTFFFVVMKLCSNSERYRNIMACILLIQTFFWQHRISISIGVRPLTMEMRCCRKKSKSKDTRQIFPPLAMSTNLRKKSSNFSKTPRKTQQNFNSKRRDPESSTDIDRQNQRLRHEI